MATVEIEGRIVKGVGGFYYISPMDSEFSSERGKIYECRGRGKFRKEGITPLVGDIVRCGIDTASNSGLVLEILPRTNSLIRPPVANVTQIVIVFSVSNPRPNLFSVDKLVTAAMYVGIRPVICINKIDMDDGDDYFGIYSGAGFKTIRLSAKTGENTEQLKEILPGELTVFVGNSGVGKSSILNRILKHANLEVGEVSGRVERGRHTTRHSELIPLDDGNGYIIDTPGFSSFSVADLDEKKLWTLFPEFEPYTGKCDFADCSHTTEKGCAVLSALRDGKISKSRHESYKAQYKEILDGKPY